MQAHVLIPGATLLAGAAMAGVVLARGPRLRANWLAVAMLGCVSGWALMQVMSGLQTRPEHAVHWVRAEALFALPLGPLALWLLSEIRPRWAARLLPWVSLAAAVALLLGLISLLTPLCVVDVQSRPARGWSPQPGPLAWLLRLVEAGVPLLVLGLLVRSPAESGGGSPSAAARTSRLAGMGIALPLLVLGVTGLLAPRTGIEALPLGTASMVLFGGLFWLASFRQGRGGISDNGFARAILDDLPDGIALVDRDGMIRSANRSLSRLVGVDRAQLVGRSIAEIVRLPATGIADGAEEREVALVADGGGPEVPVAVSGARIRDRQGGVLGSVVVARDVRPVMGLRRQLVESGRLAAVGELAAGIAHEVNNPIAFIQANLNLLRRDQVELSKALQSCRRSHRISSPLLGDGADPIDGALEGVARVAAIVREVQGFAHAGSGEPHPCDLEELLRSVLRLAALRLGETLEVESDFRDLPRVVCSGQDLKQVLLSLIRRVAASAGRGGRVRLSTRLEDDMAVVLIEPQRRAAEASGDAGVRSHRDPAAEEWEALELAIDHSIVEQQGGGLWIEPASSGGRRIGLALPVDAPSGAGPARVAGPRR